MSGADTGHIRPENNKRSDLKAKEPLSEKAAILERAAASGPVSPTQPGTVGPGTILSLQRRAGNAAVSAFLTARPSPARRHGAPATAHVQRDTGGQTSATAPASVPAPEANATDASLSFEGKTISQDPTAMRAMLEKIAAAGGLKAAKDFVGRLEGVPPDPELFERWFSGKDTGQVNSAVSVVVKQMAELETDSNTFLEKFEPAAKDQTNILLAESKKRIEDEMTRYGITSKTVSAYTPLGQILFGDVKTVEYGMANNDASNSMASAAGELAGKRQALEGLVTKQLALETRIYGGDSAGAVGAPRVTIPEDKQAEWDSLAKQIEDARLEVDLAHTQREGLYPVLAAYRAEGEGNTKALQAVAKGPSTPEGKGQVVATVTERLQNIVKVQEALAAGDVKIWKSKVILAGTKAALQASPVESRLVDDKAAEVASDEMWTNLLIGAIAIALGLIAAIPTGGLSVAGGVGVAAAGTASASLSVYQGTKTYQEFMLAQAESGTDLDKSKAISAEDPSLIWLALDIVAAGLDIKGALTLFRSLAVPVRRSLAARTAANEGRELAEEVEALRAALNATGNSELTAKVVARIGTAVDGGKAALEALEKIAKAQYQALADANRLAEIGNISEELFVKQMVSGARGQIIVAGEAGIRRTHLITDLMEPGNPRIAALLRGDAEVADALLKEHGNWKGLMTMLSMGTPEMREAAQGLLWRRGAIYVEVQEKFKTKLAGKASTEPISDIDASTLDPTPALGQERVVDTGKRMIDAEEFVKAKYGSGWSEVLRMNFYTEAGRLSFYDKIMPRLSKAERGKLLGEVTAEAEKLNVAKMLHHAGSDPRQIADVDAYAAKMGVNVQDPRVQEMLGKMNLAGDRERNKLLLELDALVARYYAASPGSPEAIALAKKITLKQMEANALTVEAYIGPGAGRMTVDSIKVIGQEAYQAAMSNVEMIMHIMHEVAGDVVIASREYEVYKYINRFAEAADAAGVKNASLDYWKNFSGFVSNTERGGTSEIAHVGNRTSATRSEKGGPVLSDLNPRIGEVTDQFLSNQYQAWKAFSQQVMGDLKKIAAENPDAWVRVNAARPAAGAKQ